MDNGRGSEADAGGRGLRLHGDGEEEGEGDSEGDSRKYYQIMIFIYYLRFVSSQSEILFITFSMMGIISSNLNIT